MTTEPIEPSNDDDKAVRAGAESRAAIRDGIDTAREKVSNAYFSGRDRAADAYSAGKDRASEAYANAREKVHSAGRSTAEGIDGNPLAALIGGLAVGAAIGALLPRTEQEAKVMGKVGARLNDAAHEAADAAKQAGKDKLDELGLSREKARDTVRSLIDGALAAAASAGNAALESAKSRDGKS
ncbi:MAG TPA: hypothetical protein VFL92_05250 [Sphingomonas sp.]|nr:hypothetical protein [Sphingomonas sp.]